MPYPSKTLKPEHDQETFLTPPALAEAAINALPDVDPSFILDPGCATGNWGKAALNRWPSAAVFGIDIRDIEKPNGYIGFKRGDFTKLLSIDAGYVQPDLVIGNPPFSLANEFVTNGLKCVRPGGRVVYLLPLTYISGQRRYEAIHRTAPLERVMVISKRPGFTGDGKTGVRTEYGIFVWQSGMTPIAPRLDFLSW